jgi:hypothetical protein
MSTGSPSVGMFSEAKRESGEMAGLKLRGMTASMFWPRRSDMVMVCESSQCFENELYHCIKEVSSKNKGNHNGKRNDESGGFQGPA